MSPNNRNLTLSKEMTSRQVIEYLGISRMTLWRLKKDRLLVPKRTDEYGAHVYSRVAVEHYERTHPRKNRKRHDGSLAADVFRMFKEGSTDQEIVMELRLRPRLVRDLREQYTDPKALVIAPQRWRKLGRELQRHGVRVQTGNELAALVVKLLETNAKLNRTLLLSMGNDEEDKSR